MKHRILLIDDDSGVLATFAAILRLEHEVVTASSAEEGLESLDMERPFSLALVDYQLPGMDGIECLRRVRESMPNTVRVAMTGLSDFDIAVKGLDAVDLFRIVRKPCGSDEFLRIVRTALVHHESLIAAIERSDQLWFAKQSLEELNSGLQARLEAQIQTLRVLQQFAVHLNGAQSLEQIARMAADASFDVLRGHAVYVQLWDKEAAHGTIEATAGSEMSSRLASELLAVGEECLGEIVVDELGPHGAPLRERDRESLKMIAGPTAVAAQNQLRRRERDRAQHSTILALARLAEQRDNETGNHIERVSQYCSLVAEGLREEGHYRDEIDDRFVSDLVRSAPLHDIGKVGIPDSILLKPGRLTPGEWEVMKTHAEIGADTLQEVIRDNSSENYLLMGRDIAWCHHEHWNGEGYPRGLSGEEIPLPARILALADIYDALTTDRPYKEAWPHQKAVDHIGDLAGSHLDPLVVQVFLARVGEANQIRIRLADSAEESSARLRAS